PLTELLDALAIEIPTSAVGLRLVGADGYHAGIPLEDLFEGPVWIVWRMNGEDLPFDHGAPARLLVPGRYGVKNLKWLDEIAFVDTPHVSYWTPKGWSEEAVYQPNTMIVSPMDGMKLEANLPTRILGTAYAGGDPVVKVEARLDGGSWEEIDVEYVSSSPDTWVLWSYAFTPTEGDHTIQVRCTTASGARSSDEPAGTDQFHGYDGSMQITVSA
ncbi:MAG: molybdopterin-dependent oxidoreductase, partial [Myxococcales bacterium]|nr:molybdopterin-dependent oxidoreductase [Myxococcales bacterium]